MEDMIEIRWHGRGGQGAKTASQLLADAAFMSGKYVQSFPEYGPERSGAPILASFFVRDLQNVPTLGMKHSHAGEKTFPRWE